MEALLMRARYAVLSLTLLIAGCSACAERRPLKAIKTLDGQQKVATVKEAAASFPQAGQDLRYRLSDLLNETVRDKTGKEVARLGDLAIGAHGRILSVTLIPAGGTGAKITIPFERLKVTGRDGSLYLETDVVVGAGDGPGSKTAQGVQEQKTSTGALKDTESKPQ
jgi:sporulation protein YlmC with PRC-barrel domain